MPRSRVLTIDLVMRMCLLGELPVESVQEYLEGHFEFFFTAVLAEQGPEPLYFGGLVEGEVPVAVRDARISFIQWFFDRRGLGSADRGF